MINNEKLSVIKTRKLMANCLLKPTLQNNVLSSVVGLIPTFFVVWFFMLKPTFDNITIDKMDAAAVEYYHDFFNNNTAMLSMGVSLYLISVMIVFITIVAGYLILSLLKTSRYFIRKIRTK